MHFLKGLIPVQEKILRLARSRKVGEKDRWRFFSQKLTLSESLLLLLHCGGVDAVGRKLGHVPQLLRVHHVG